LMDVICMIPNALLLEVLHTIQLDDSPFMSLNIGYQR
jgi:hypothetical protein